MSGKGTKPKSNPSRVLQADQCKEETEEDKAIIELFSKTRFFDKREKVCPGLNTTLLETTIRFEGPPESVEDAIHAMKLQKKLVTTQYRAVDKEVSIFLTMPEVIGEINYILAAKKIICTWRSNGEACILTHAYKKDVATKAANQIISAVTSLNLSPDTADSPEVKRFLRQNQQKLHVKTNNDSDKILVVMTLQTFQQNSKMFETEEIPKLAAKSPIEIPAYQETKKLQQVGDNIILINQWKLRYLEVFGEDNIMQLLARKDVIYKSEAGLIAIYCSDLKVAKLEIEKGLSNVCQKTDQTWISTSKLPDSFYRKCAQLETRTQCMISVSNEAYLYSGWCSKKDKVNIFTVIGPCETYSLDVLICPVKTNLNLAFNGWEDVVYIDELKTMDTPIIPQKGDYDVQVGCETHRRKVNGRVKPNEIVTLYQTGDLGCHALSLVPLEDVLAVKDKYMTFIVQQIIDLLNKESFRSIGVSIGNNDIRYGSFTDFFIRKFWKVRNDLRNNTSLYILGDSASIIDEVSDSVIKKNSMNAGRVPITFDKMTFMSGINDQSITVDIVIGSILDQHNKVDVIVNSTNTELRLDSGGVSKQLVQAGGTGTILKDCKEKYPKGVYFGEVAVTIAGNLKCQALFHGALPERITHGNISFQIVKVFVSRCLAEAERRKFKSIAFPALGTGILAYPTCMVAKAMFDSVGDFWENHSPSTLKIVQFVLFQDDRHTVEIFQNVQKWAKLMRKPRKTSYDIPPQHMININKSHDIRFVLADADSWEILNYLEVRIDVHKVFSEKEIGVCRLYWNNSFGCFMIDVHINQSTKNLKNCFSQVIAAVEDYRFQTVDFFLPSVGDLGISAQQQVDIVMESVVTNADMIKKNSKKTSFVTNVRIFLHENDYWEMARSFSSREHEKQIDEASDWFVSNGHSIHSKVHIEVIGAEENAAEIIKTLKNNLSTLKGDEVVLLCNSAGFIRRYKCTGRLGQLIEGVTKALYCLSTHDCMVQDDDILQIQIRTDAMKETKAVLDTTNTGGVQLDEKNCSVSIKGTDEHISPINPLNMSCATTDMPCVSSSITSKSTPDNYDIYLLLEAAERGEIEQVVKILNKNPTLVNEASKGKTALMFASCNGHQDVVEYLIENKARVSQQDFDGNDALHFAVYSTDSDIIRILLSNGADINAINKKNQSALLIAVNEALPQCCRVLINNGCDPNLKDLQGDTAMHDAISKHDAANDILKIVLGSKTARFTTENAKGFNVLQWAVITGNKMAVEIICISHDLSCVNAKLIEGGSTALHIAAVNNRVEIASILLEKGQADINSRDDRKRTPLILAVGQDQKQMIDFLIGHDDGVFNINPSSFLLTDCDINLEECKGNTALHVAQVKKEMSVGSGEICRSDAQLICTLIEKGADVTIKNINGHTPIDLACDETAKIFMKKLAEKVEEQACAKTALGLPMPPYWSEMNDLNNSTFNIMKSQGGFRKMEWESIEHKFEKTLPHSQILTIERIQNKYLWEMYYLTRGLLEKKYGKELHNELILFHGTDPDNVHYIKEENLDPRLAGQKTGAILGKGTYFAIDANYSDVFAKADKDGNKYMLLVKVLAGKSCNGKKNYLRPPRQDPNNKFSPPFDSCFDNQKCPKVYCIFDSRQYYPEYIIKYTAKPSESE